MSLASAHASALRMRVSSSSRRYWARDSMPLPAALNARRPLLVLGSSCYLWPATPSSRAAPC
eukprot:1222793-Alexandrium_andersonii.AAC.1